MFVFLSIYTGVSLLILKGFYGRNFYHYTESWDQCITWNHFIKSTKSAKMFKKTALVRNTPRLFSKLTKKQYWRAFKEEGEGGGGWWIKTWFIIWDLSLGTSWVACLLKKSNLPIKKRYRYEKKIVSYVHNFKWKCNYWCCYLKTP